MVTQPHCVVTVLYLVAHGKDLIDCSEHFPLSTGTKSGSYTIIYRGLLPLSTSTEQPLLWNFRQFQTCRRLRVASWKSLRCNCKIITLYMPAHSFVLFYLVEHFYCQVQLTRKVYRRHLILFVSRISTYTKRGCGNREVQNKTVNDNT